MKIPHPSDTAMDDDVYDALVPLDGFRKGSRGGPRPYRLDADGRSFILVVSLSDFGDVLVGPVMECAS